MGASETLESFKNIGNPYPTPTSYKDRRRHLSCEFGERGVVVRAGSKVQQSSDRRKQSFQGPLYQEIQSAEEELKELPKTYNPDWYSNTTGYGRSVGTGGYLGPRHEVRNQSDTIQRHLSTTRSDEPTHKSCVLLETKTRS